MKQWEQLILYLKPLLDPKVNSAKIRIFGSTLLLIGYFILLHIDVMLGCWLRLIGGCLMIPFAISIKTWDVVMLLSFFAVMDASKIVEILVT